MVKTSKPHSEGENIPDGSESTACESYAYISVSLSLGSVVL